MKEKIKKVLSKQGFTLVELIIVIAIISVLSVAAFMMLTKWLANSRDSRRLADMGTIKKALEVDYTELGYYPTPDGMKYILDEEGNQMWYIGHIGQSVIEEIDSLNKAPNDPSDQSNYNYAVTLNKQEFQIGVLLEKGETVSHVANNTYAIQREFTTDDIGSLSSDIDGRYDGFVSYATGGNTYVVRTDSLLVWTGNVLDTDGVNENLMLDEQLLGEESQLYDLEILPGDSNDEIIGKAVLELNLAEDTTDVTSKVINIIESNTSIDLEPIEHPYCVLDGNIVTHGNSITAYSAPNVSFGNSCDDIKVTRTCSDGTFDLDNSYSHASCYVGEPDNCDATPTYNGRTYNIPALDHGDSTSLSITLDENHGTFDYTLDIECFDGEHIASETGPTLQSCESLYGWNGSACVYCSISTSGTVTKTGNIYKFTAGAGSFTTTCPITVDLLVVGGGAGAARGKVDYTSSAPGGGGGVQYLTDYTLTNNTYNLTVGAGGAFTGRGKSSYFGTITAGGGNRGSGTRGGSSGAPQSNAGSSNRSRPYAGGAGGSGGAASGVRSGGGRAISITGTEITYAAGGASRGTTGAISGPANRGKGGAGQNGRGGSGVVVVKVK